MGRSGRSYDRHFFLAQVVALLGTGLATVALGLLAYDLAGEQAGHVLGAIFTIKMVAYVVVAPIATAFVDHLPRRTLLVCLDIVRAVIALLLPFVNEIWQIYVLIFVLQSASAAFTPAFQATIPDVLPDEERYTRALSLSRLAYDLENIVSPIPAALLLMVVSSGALFYGTLSGFAASAALVLSVVLPNPQPAAKRGIYERTTRGIRIYFKSIDPVGSAPAKIGPRRESAGAFRCSVCPVTCMLARHLSAGRLGDDDSRACACTAGSGWTCGSGHHSGSSHLAEEQIRHAGTPA